MEEQNTDAEVIPAVPSILPELSLGVVPAVPSVMPEMSPGQKRQCERSLDELEDAKKLKPDEQHPEDNVQVQEPGSGNRKIYIGNLPASVVEAGLVAYFRTFGNVIDCKVIRDRDSGVSRGFAFLTFLDESMADAATDYENHKLDGKPIRVSYAQDNASSLPRATKKVGEYNILDLVSLPRTQVRVYIGPLDDDVTNHDLMMQLNQYGFIKGISKLGARESAVKKSIALVDFKDAISVRRVFTNKIFIKGKHVRVTLSRLALELILGRTTVFFYEAHELCEKKSLEQHFSQYGQIFRCSQVMEEDFQYPKPYGFVDFVDSESVSRAILSKQQLLTNQYVRVSRWLPQNLQLDLMAMADKHANATIRKLEQTLPDQSVWAIQGFKDSNEHKTSQVKIPSNMVGKLIGERGKTIAGICRDSKTKIAIPRNQQDNSATSQEKTIISITGTQMNIKAAQYLMQKLLKPR